MTSHLNHHDLTAAYADVGDALKRVIEEEGQSRFLITGTDRNVGVTTACFGLAQTLSRYGLRVLLIDADVDNVDMTQQVAPHQKDGLVQLLSEQTESCEIQVTGSNNDSFHVLPLGQEQQRLESLLHSNTADQNLKRLSTSYDCTIIDAAPAYHHRTTIAFARHVDGCIVLARAERTHRKDLINTRQRLEQIPCKVLGAILNHKKQRGSRLFRRWM